MAKSLLNRITCFWETMLTEEDNLLKQFVFSSPSKLNILKTFSFCVETMKAALLIGFTAFMMSAREDTIYKFGNNFRCVSIICLLRL